MTNREVGFLLIGFGAGLVFAVAILIEFVALLSHHMFIVGRLTSALVFLAVPFLFVLVGVLLLRKQTIRNPS